MFTFARLIGTLNYCFVSIEYFYLRILNMREIHVFLLYMIKYINIFYDALLSPSGLKRAVKIVKADI